MNLISIALKLLANWESQRILTHWMQELPRFSGNRILVHQFREFLWRGSGCPD